MDTMNNGNYSDASYLKKLKYAMAVAGNMD